MRRPRRLFRSSSLWQKKQGAAYWTAFGLINQGYLWAVTGSVANGVSTLSSGIAALAINRSKYLDALLVSQLARAYAELGDFQKASRCIKEAIHAVKTTKEKWCEVDISRIAGEIALISPEQEL